MGVGRLRRPAQLAGSARTVEGLRSRQLEIPAVRISCHASSCFRLMVVELSLRCRARPGRASPCRVLFERALNRRRVALRCTFRCRGIYCACCALKALFLVSVAALAVPAAGALHFTTSSSYHRPPKGRKFRTPVRHTSDLYGIRGTQGDGGDAVCVPGQDPCFQKGPVYENGKRILSRGLKLPINFSCERGLSGRCSGPTPATSPPALPPPRAYRPPPSSPSSSVPAP